MMAVTVTLVTAVHWKTWKGGKHNRWSCADALKYRVSPTRGLLQRTQLT